MRQALRGVLALCALCLASSSALAKPPRVMPPEALQILTGPFEVVSNETAVEVTLLGLRPAEARLFRVETVGPLLLPSSFIVGSGEILFWQGHLLLLVPGERKAFHFSIPDLRPPIRRLPDQDLEPVLRAPDLPSVLAGYEVTQIDSATAILSASGPRAQISIPRDGRIPRTKDWGEENQDPNLGGGLGGCGTTCSITCGDGSSCTASCGSLRCASCKCPATCSCS